MMTAAQSLIEGMQDHVRRTEGLLRGIDYPKVAALTEKLHEAYREDRRVFLFGNGGSAACASHFAEDLAKGTVLDLERQKRLRVMSLTDCTPFITALGNDCGYQTIFKEQLRTHGEPGDIALGISGSGNSPNVLSAIEWARENGLYTVGMTGFDGGKLRGMVDLSIHFPMKDMEVSENLHLIAVHLVVGGLRKLING